MGSGIPQVRIDASAVLVKPEVAQAQLEAAEGGGGGTGGGGTGGTGGRTGGGSCGGAGGTGVTVTAAPTRFFGTVRLDPTRAGGDAAKIADEVIRHLAGLLGADVSVTLDIDARLDGGFPPDVIRTVTENARTLGFNTQGFEEE